MEKVTVYAGWFYCNERRAYYRWEEFINYEWEKDAHISRYCVLNGELRCHIHFQMSFTE